MSSQDTHILKDPSARVRFIQNLTRCSKYVRKEEIAAREQDATCPTCKERVEQYEKLDI